MDDVQYDNQDIQGTVGGKLALIDSGNTSIQLPASEFDQLKAFMKEQDDTLYEQVVEEHTILVSRNECKDLYDLYGDLKFMLHKTQVIIKPQGYLYSLYNQKDCFVGV